MAAASTSAAPASSSEKAPASSSSATPSSSSIASSSDAAPASSSEKGPLNVAPDAKGLAVGRVLVSENALVVPVTLSKASSAKIGVYTVLGQQILTLNRELAAGESTLSLDRALLPAGEYMISVQVGSARSMARIGITR